MPGRIRSQDMIDRRVKAGRDAGVPPFLAGAGEAAFDTTIVEFAEHRGWKLTYHTWNSQRSEAGFPDRVFIHRGWRRFLIVEIKDMIRQVTDEQAAWLDALHDCGIECGVWRPSDWEQIERVLSVRFELLIPERFTSAWPCKRETDKIAAREKRRIAKLTGVPLPRPRKTRPV